MSKTVFTLYGQLGLWDQEDKTSYPQFVTGKESFIFNKKGIAIATPIDKDIVVNVELKEEKTTTLIKLVDTVINIGNQGLCYGNIPANTVYKMNVMPGNYKVTVFTDGERREEISQIKFLLEKI